MPGGFGTSGYPHPRRCDQQPVESFTPLNPCALAARGHLLLPGVTTVWRFSSFTAVITVEHATRVLISIDGRDPIGVGIVRQGLLGQLLFVCPGPCARWRRNLYVVKDGALRCRCCAALDYRSRHEARRGAARAAHRVTKLRQRLNANPVPFSELPPPPPPRHHRRRRVYDQILAYEAAALAAFGDTVAAAERRARSKRVRR